MSDPTSIDLKTDEQRKLEGRRSALKAMGAVAAYTAPVLLATSIPTRAARASGSTSSSAGGGGGLPFEFSGPAGTPTPVVITGPVPSPTPIKITP
ncbi:hypothetical protein GCM10007890_66630 [Methylobacterium tardum]|uniref:Uncharacterized protein n=1 Tax=Methylobacterium tardum TaxID=374432 RepID=A0AA37TK28_9HYPH|nr:hypothetical protein GCM10007890_66630 [Methylobacterium tardum]